MIDYIIIAVVAIIVGLAFYYVYREKKKGNACIGCPNAGCCNVKKCKDTHGCDCYKSCEK